MQVEKIWNLTMVSGTRKVTNMRKHDHCCLTDYVCSQSLLSSKTCRFLLKQEDRSQTRTEETNLQQMVAAESSLYYLTLTICVSFL